MKSDIYKFSLQNQPGDKVGTLPQTYLKFKNSDEFQPQTRLRILRNNKPIQVLIADNDAQARYQLGLQLTACKCVVTSVSSGSAAIKAVEENPEIDLVIINWIMPGLSGLLTAKTIKNISPQIHVLVTVGEKFIQAVETAFPTMADGYIQKPANMFSLKDILPHLALVGKRNATARQVCHEKFTIKYDPENRGYSYKSMLVGA